MFFIYNLTVYMILQFFFSNSIILRGKRASHPIWWIRMCWGNNTWMRRLVSGSEKRANSFCLFSVLSWAMLSLASPFPHVCHFDSMEWGGEDPEIFPKNISPVTNFLLLIPPPYDSTTFKQLDKQATKPLPHVWS